MMLLYTNELSSSRLYTDVEFDKLLIIPYHILCSFVESLKFVGANFCECLNLKDSWGHNFVYSRKPTKVNMT